MKKLIASLDGRLFLPAMFILFLGSFAYATEPFDSTRSDLGKLDASARLGINYDVVTLIEQLDQELVLDYLEDIVGFGPRVTNTPACDRAADYILDEFEVMGLDADMLSLYPDGYTLNSTTADSINFTLDAELANANRNYVLLAGVSGSDPGTALPGGYATLPLNWDVMTDLALQNLNSPVFSGFLGKLDAAGRATAQMNTFGPLPASAVGARLSFAYACNNFFDYVSNPVTVEVID